MLLVPQALFVGGCSALAIAARVAAAVSRGGGAAVDTSGARSASDVEFCFWRSASGQLTLRELSSQCAASSGAIIQ